MESCTFMYDDGTWGIEKGTYVELNNYFDDPFCKYNEVVYLELIPKNSPKLKIPMAHIVEIDFITNETLHDKSKLLRGLVGLGVTGGVVVGLGIAAMINPLTLLTAGLGFGKFTLSGGVIGALTGFGSKKKKENYCIISYLNENEPEDLKIIILNANISFGNCFVKDRQNFVKNLQMRINRIKKADCVKAYMLEVKKELEKQESKFKEQDKQRIAMLENSAREIDGFLFRVDEVFSINAKGTVASGKVETGSVSVRDEVYLVKSSGNTQVRFISGIEMFRKEIQTANKGDNIGLALLATKQHEVEHGDIICTSDVIETGKLIAMGVISMQLVTEQYGSSFYADIKVSDIDTGGSNPLLEGGEYTFCFGSKVFTGTMRFPSDRDSKLLPDAEDAVIIKFSNPIIVRKGFEFSILYGDMIKAKGVVSEICND